jgi:hypothetical protein
MIGAISRFAGPGLVRALKVGAPTWTDAAMNAVPSAIWGASLLSQGANAGEAAGAAALDLGLQMGLDTVFGTVGARIGQKMAPQSVKDRVMAGKGDLALRRHMGRVAGPAKMLSMATMLMPNPVANSFYDRLQREQQGSLQAQALEQGVSRDPYTQYLLSQLSPQQQQQFASMG